MGIGTRVPCLLPFCASRSCAARQRGGGVWLCSPAPVVLCVSMTRAWVPSASDSRLSSSPVRAVCRPGPRPRALVVVPGPCRAWPWPHPGPGPRGGHTGPQSVPLPRCSAHRTARAQGRASAPCGLGACAGLRRAGGGLTGHLWCNQPLVTTSSEAAGTGSAEPSPSGLTGVLSVRPPSLGKSGAPSLPSPDTPPRSPGHQRGEGTGVLCAWVAFLKGSGWALRLFPGERPSPARALEPRVPATHPGWPAPAGGSAGPAVARAGAGGGTTMTGDRTQAGGQGTAPGLARWA